MKDVITMVLLVIDTQKLIINEKLYELNKFIFNIKEIYMMRKRLII